MHSLFDSAPGFDQPLAVLAHCHGRIRKQLATLEKLVNHLEYEGTDEQAQQAATTVLRYFNKAAPLHHEDEEIDLLPALRQSATGEDARLLEELIQKILEQHVQMAERWESLRIQLQAIKTGDGFDLSAVDVEEFSELYQAHMQIEEGQIAPMAGRILSAEQMQALGAAMQARRGIET